MTGLIRLTKCELLKVRHTVLFWLHILIPVIGMGIFLLYYSYSAWTPEGKVHAYLQATAIVYPFLISILCPMAVEIEEEGCLQTLFLMAGKKRNALFSKWLALQLLSFGAIFLTVCGFGIGFHFVVGTDPFPAVVYMKAVLLLWICGAVLYFWHLFLGFRFGKGVSIGFGIGEMLLPALMLTGLGEGIWQFIPCAWGGRWCDYLLLYSIEGWDQAYQNLKGELHVCIVLAVLIIGTVFLWFHYFEGRRCQD